MNAGKKPTLFPLFPLFFVRNSHSQSGCDPDNYDRVHKKKRCPVPFCKEKLTTVNQFACKDCGATVCLKHRLAGDHKCPGPAKTAVAAAAVRMKNPFTALFNSSGSGNKPAVMGAKATTRAGGAASAAGAKKKAAAAAAAGASTSQGRAAAALTSVQSQLAQYRQKHIARSMPQQPVAAAPARPAEICSVCGAGFSAVQELLDHAAAAHAEGWSSGQMTGGIDGYGAGKDGAVLGPERCPFCPARFQGPEALVAHVEAQHSGEQLQGGDASTCVLS
jgi:hypothetical protein